MFVVSMLWKLQEEKNKNTHNIKFDGNWWLGGEQKGVKCGIKSSNFHNVLIAIENGNSYEDLMNFFKL